MFIAERMARLGTESAFEVLARAAALAQKGQSIINLGIGQPDFATPQNIVEAGRKALADGHHGYTPANGILPLREAVAADIRARRGVEVNPDHVLVVPGGKPTMFFACLMFGEPGAEIMYPNPGFPIYESAIRFAGATPVPIKLHEKNGYAFDANEVLSAITPRTRLIILNSPANPTGGVVPQQELEKLAFGLQSHPDVAIMSDEIYSRMVYDNQPHHSMMPSRCQARSILGVNEAGLPGSGPPTSTIRTFKRSRKMRAASTKMPTPLSQSVRAAISTITGPCGSDVGAKRCGSVPTPSISQARDGGVNLCSEK